MSKIENVLRGADPELFLMDSNGVPVTSIGLIGGSKNFPRPLGNGFALQEDNVAVEFNIPPAPTKEQFVSSLNYVLEFLKQELEPKGLFLDISATANFTKEQLDNEQAQTLGCEPDYNAYTLSVNPRPIAPEFMRSSGGHLHLGWDNPTNEQKIEIIKGHDVFCGAFSILHDKDRERRKIYGKGGAFRDKPYGAEYRTLSNFWLASQELQERIYHQSEKAVDYYNSGNIIDPEDYDIIQKCINETDFKAFSYLNEKYSIL